ncbi:MAG: ABC transporter substrate-binding protein [Gammaproteobacteria bacterium]
MNSKIRSISNRVGRWLGMSLGLVAASLMVVGGAQAKDYGKPGDPIHLVVGYQPYYTESWSGVVMRGKQLWKKYLPKGSTVEFQIGLQGAIIVNAMLAGKEDIGYMGDMPAIVSTTKTRVADIRMVAVPGYAWDQCNILIVRNDAPKFANPIDAFKWMNGKRVATAKGACSDRFLRASFKKLGIKPAEYLNQNIEVMTSGFKAGKLDAAVIWEPTASKIVQEGIARRAGSGFNIQEHDGAFLNMRADLIKQRPDVVKGWLKAELDAQQYMANPKHAKEIAKIAAGYTTGFSTKEMWMAFTGKYPASQGGTDSRLILPFAFTPEIMDLIRKDTKFLHSVKSINVSKLRPEAVMPEFANEILKERGLTAPVGEVKSVPESDYND